MELIGALWEQYRGSANGCQLPVAQQRQQCKENRSLRKSAHLRVPMERARHYREQARTLGPEETNVSSAQRFGQCTDTNSGDASGLSGRKCVADSSIPVDAYRFMGSLKRAHRIPRLGRYSSSSAAAESLLSRPRVAASSNAAMG